MARLASSPEYHMLPFEKEFISPIYGMQTSTTVYRGKINITFIMDDPFWYAKHNIVSYNGGIITDYINNTAINMPIEDILKFVEEDGIPLVGSVTDNILIGKNVNVNVQSKPARTWKTGDTSSSSPEAYIGAIIGGSSTISIINGPNIDSLAAGTKAFFYYPGTAPSYPHLKFKLLTICAGNSPFYITSPKNKYGTPSTPYNTITISSTTTKQFKFTTPSFLTACN
jgi:hypothetical protein